MSSLDSALCNGGPASPSRFDPLPTRSPAHRSAAHPSPRRAPPTDHHAHHRYRPDRRATPQALSQACAAPSMTKPPVASSPVGQRDRSTSRWVVLPSAGLTLLSAARVDARVRGATRRRRPPAPAHLNRRASVRGGRRPLSDCDHRRPPPAWRSTWHTTIRRPRSPRTPVRGWRGRCGRGLTAPP